jgi:hypothetical protein
VPGHSSGRDNDHDVVDALERRDKLIEMGADDGNRVRLLAVEPHMASNRVFIRRLVNSRSWVISTASRSSA